MEISNRSSGTTVADIATEDLARAVAAALQTRTGREPSFVDLHGHGHAKARVQIGYLLGSADLGRPDVELDDPASARQSSIRVLAAESGLRFSALLRGPVSLGGLLERTGYPAVPSPAASDPGTDPYVEGGHITRRHGSIDGRQMSAVQIEMAYPELCGSPTARARCADALAEAPFT